MLSKKQIVALHLAFLNSKIKISPADIEIIKSIKAESLTEEEGIKRIIKLVKQRAPSDTSLKKLLADAEKQILLAEQNDASIVTFFDPEYPKRLQSLIEIKEAPLPLILFVKGNINIFNAEHAAAVVGARNATQTAKAMSLSFAKDLALDNWCIVSGLATGCDAYAHKGAIQSEVGKTIAVMGHGLQMIFPSEHVSLAQNIIDNNGCLVSIYPFGTGLKRAQFCERNALQVGLSDATVVIQAEDERSGTMVTANHSIKQNRPLFCVDPNLDRSGSYNGNAALLKNSANNRVKIVDPYNVAEFKNILDMTTELKKPKKRLQFTLDQFLDKQDDSKIADGNLSAKKKLKL